MSNNNQPVKPKKTTFEVNLTFEYKEFHGTLFVDVVTDNVADAEQIATGLFKEVMLDEIFITGASVF